MNDAPRHVEYSPTVPATAQRVRACAIHGTVDGAERKCGACSRMTYDLDEPDDFAVMRSLRHVAKQRRVMQSAITAVTVSALLVLFLDVVVFRKIPTANLTIATFVLLIAAGLTLPIERLKRALQPKAMRDVDRRVLSKTSNAPPRQRLPPPPDA